MESREYDEHEEFMKNGPWMAFDEIFPGHKPRIVLDIL